MVVERDAFDDRLKAWARLPRRDPGAFLEELLALQAKGARAGWLHDPEKRRLLLLRRGTHKPVRELRDACVFSILMGRALGLDLRVIRADRENGDADAVAFWEDGMNGDKVERYCPIQLKELVPVYLNPFASLNGVLRKFEKYHGPADFIGAVFLNRRFRFEPDKIVVPPGLRLAGLWLFGSPKRDGSRWILVGDLMKPIASWRTVETGPPI